MSCIAVSLSATLAEAQPVPAVEYAPQLGRYVASRALVEDYLVCATEARLLLASDAEAAALIEAVERERDALGESAATAGLALASCSAATRAATLRGDLLAEDGARWRGEAAAAREAEARASRRAARWKALSFITTGAGVALAGILLAR